MVNLMDLVSVMVLIYLRLPVQYPETRKQYLAKYFVQSTYDDTAKVHSYHRL